MLRKTGRYLKSAPVRLFISNVSWQTLERGLRILMGLLTGLWLAAYLGPNALGTYSYALAFVALFSPLITLGYDGFISRDLLLQKEKTTEILGSSALLRFGGALLAIMFIILIAAFTPWVPSRAYALVLVLSLSYLFQATDVIDIYFRAKLQAKYAAVSRILALLISNALKIYLILTKASLMAFAGVYVLEYVIAAILLLLMYAFSLKESVRQWQVTGERIRFIFMESWPLLVASLSYIIYTRIDQIMLGQMMNDTAVGLYSASIKFYEIPLALIMIVNASIYPYQAQHYKNSYALFYRKYRALTEAYTLGSYLLFLVVLIGAGWIVRILPASFAASADLMRIHFIGLIFIYNSGTRNAYFSLTGNQRFLLITTLASALLNIGLNFVLIPMYQVQGAAWATVITQFCSLLLLNVLFRRTRPVFYTQIKSFVPLQLFREAGLFFRNISDPA